VRTELTRISLYRPDNAIKNHFNTSLQRSKRRAGVSTSASTSTLIGSPRAQTRPASPRFSPYARKSSASPRTHSRTSSKASIASSASASSLASIASGTPTSPSPLSTPRPPSPRLAARPAGRNLSKEFFEAPVTAQPHAYQIYGGQPWTPPTTPDDSPSNASQSMSPRQMASPRHDFPFGFFATMPTPAMEQSASTPGCIQSTGQFPNPPPTGHVHQALTTPLHSSYPLMPSASDPGMQSFPGHNPFTDAAAYTHIPVRQQLMGPWDPSSSVHTQPPEQNPQAIGYPQGYQSVRQPFPVGSTTGQQAQATGPMMDMSNVQFGHRVLRSEEQ
jgi:hypothetical protein